VYSSLSIPLTWFIPAVAPIIVGSISAIVLDRNNDIKTSIQTNYKAFLVLAAVLYGASLYLADYLGGFVYIVQALGIACLLAVLQLRQDNRISAFLGKQPLVYLGRISYSIYVFQGLFLGTGPGGHLWIQQFPQNIILALVVAALSYHFVESPILRFKERFR
jgi:peptidoglycan/LPS O-acetylase OafA/YrhL